MSPQVTIRHLELQDSPALRALIDRSFERFVQQDLSPQGCEAFYDQVASVLGDNNREYTTFTALQDRHPVGVLSLRQQTHVCLFFCDVDYLDRGIGRALLNAAQHFLVEKLHRDVTLTVNSSLYAVKIYQKLGFAPRGEVESINGIRFQMMEKHLLVGSSSH